MLVDDARQPVSEDAWWLLPAETRANAVSDFNRVARGNAKAVVLFLRP
jgi:hypothetical protein